MPMSAVRKHHPEWFQELVVQRHRPPQPWSTHGLPFWSWPTTRVWLLLGLPWTFVTIWKR